MPFVGSRLWVRPMDWMVEYCNETILWQHVSKPGQMHATMRTCEVPESKDTYRYVYSRDGIFPIFGRCLIFSSTAQRPESYCHGVVSVMHPSIHLFVLACLCKLFLQKTSPEKLMTGLLPNFTGMFLRWSSFKFLQIIVATKVKNLWKSFPPKPLIG